MASLNSLPPLPQGFVLESPDEQATGQTMDLPPLPSGFEIEQPGIGRATAAPAESWELTKGFVGGLVGTNPAMFGNAAEAIGHVVGSTSLVDVGKKVQGYGEKQLEKYRARVPSLDNIRTDDVGNFVEDTISYAGYGLGQGVASTVPSLATGGTVGLLTANPMVGVIAGAAGPSYIQNLGDVYGGLKSELKDRLDSGEMSYADVSRAAMFAAIPMAALDVVGVGKLAGTFSAAKKELQRNVITRVAAAASKGFAVEGITEGMQEAISQWTQSYMGDTDLATRERFISIVDNAIVGGLAGGGIGGVGGAMARAKPSPAPPPAETPEPKTAEAEVPAEEIPPLPPGFEIDPDTGIAIAAAQAAEVDAAAAEAAPAPTDAQKEAGNYRKGHVNIQGLDVTIETPRGGERSGISPEGVPWSVTMPAHYGYVKRSEAADGEQLDVYVGQTPNATDVYVVDQIDPATGNFDEHKAILGASSEEEAVAIYDAAFSDASGPQRRGAVTSMSVPSFRQWLKKGDTKKPIFYRTVSAAPGAIPVERGEAAPGAGPTQRVTAPGAAARAKRPTKPRSVLTIIRNLGGIQPSAETRLRDLHIVAPGMVAKKGRKLNDIRVAFEEIGLLPEGSSDDAVFDLIDQHVKGKAPVIHPEDITQEISRRPTADPDEIRFRLENQAAEFGIDPAAFEDIDDLADAVAEAREERLAIQQMDAEGADAEADRIAAEVDALVGQAVDEQLAATGENILDEVPFPDVEPTAETGAQREPGAVTPEDAQIAEPAAAPPAAPAESAGPREVGGAPAPEGEAVAPKEEKRFEAGRKLSKEERQATLRTLRDVYVENNLPKEGYVDARGEERFRYPHTPDLFVKSDVTGAMVRYYVTLPDGRIAHPTELFPDYTASDVEAEMRRREQTLENIEFLAKQQIEDRNQFDSIAAAKAEWDARSRKSAQESVHGRPTVYDSSQRTAFSDGERFILVSDTPDHQSQEFVQALANLGWTPVSAEKPPSIGAELTPFVLPADDEPINPKVAPLVEALNKAGIRTVMSGDMYGDEIVYVDIDPRSLPRGKTLWDYADDFPEGWKAVHNNIYATKYETIGYEPTERQFEQMANVAASSPPIRLAKAGKSISRTEIDQIVAALKGARNTNAEIVAKINAMLDERYPGVAQRIASIKQTPLEGLVLEAARRERRPEYFWDVDFTDGEGFRLTAYEVKTAEQAAIEALRRQAWFDEQEGKIITERTMAGEQAVIPGAERISDRALIERRMRGRKVVQAPQKPFDEGLADVEGRRQQDLEDFLGPDEKAAAAYHGSPYDFERFTTEKIGAGEGAQAYGWGLYFAGRKEVADYYRHALAGKTWRVEDELVSAKALRDVLRRKIGAKAVERAGMIITEIEFGYDRGDILRNAEHRGEGDLARQLLDLIEPLSESEKGELIGRIKNKNRADYTVDETLGIQKALADINYHIRKGDVSIDEARQLALKEIERVNPIRADNAARNRERLNSLLNNPRADREELLEARMRVHDSEWFDREYKSAEKLLRDPDFIILDNREIGGRLYKVDLAPAEDEYLYWDEPVYKQPPKVRDALAKTGFTTWPNRQDPISGSVLYREIGKRVGRGTRYYPDQEAASKYLASLGVPGIKYLDQGTRETFGGEIIRIAKEDGKWRSVIRVADREGGFNVSTDIITTSPPFDTRQAAEDWANQKIRTGSYNYVIFDENLINIVEKAAVGPAFSPAFTEKRDQIVGKLRDILRMIAPGAKLRAVDAIWRDAEKTQQLRGSANPVTNLVTVSLGYGDPINTLRHEAVHVLRSMGLFTEAEWSVLEREAQRNWRPAYAVDQRWSDLGLSDDALNEEAIAEAFGDWRSGKQFAPGFRKLFARIELFLKRLANALRGLGFQSAEDVFEHIETGRIGARGPDGAPLTVRSPWADFPKVVIQRGLGFAKTSTDFAAAKAGDDEAAWRVVEAAVTDENLLRIRDTIGDRNPIIMPVVSEERTGSNRIPSQYAAFIGHALGLEVDTGVVQSNRVGRTDAGAWHRFAFQPVFEGPVEAGRDYVIVDDTVTMGGTLANLRGYIESNGGNVILATALTGQGRSSQIAASSDQITTLREKHGPALEDWWQREFGHGFEALTEAEARNLIQVGSADGIRNRIVAAKERGIAATQPRIRRSQPPAAGAQGQAREKFAVGGPADRALASMSAKIGEPHISSWQKLKQLLVDRPLHRIRQGIFDDLHGLKLLEMAANKGDLYQDARSAAKLAYLSRGVGDVVFEAMYSGAPIWKEGTTAIDTSVKAPMQTIEEIGDALWNFELYMVARRAQELKTPTEQFPEGRENLFSDEEIAAGLALEQKHPDFRRHFDDLQTYNDRLLDFAQQSGLIDAEGRAFFNEMHRNYVPFFRIMEGGGTKAPRARLGFAGQHPNFYKLTGGTANIDHPLLNWERNVHRLIEASVKNVVMLRTAQLNAQLGNMFMTQVGRTVRQALVTNAQMIRDLEKQGIEISQEDNVDPDSIRVLWSLGNRPRGDNIVSLVRGGKVEFYEVHDPMLFRSLTMLHRVPLPFIAPFRWAKHLLTAAVGLDPSFQIANFLRDTAHAAVISHIGFKPIIGSARGLVGRFRKDQSWREFLGAGAGMSSLFEADRPTMHRVVETKIRKHRGIVGKIVDNPRGFIGMLEHFESTFEYSTRLGAFKKLREEGVPLMEAAWQARQISTDFSMRGEWLAMRLLAETVPFLNAGVQGLYRTAAGAAENPLSFFVKGSIVAMLSIALYLINRDDERFRELSDYERDTYWHFWIADTHYKIPKPFEVGAIFGSMMERSAEVAIEREGDRFLHRMHWIFTEMFRLGYVPQLVQPPLRIYSNWDEFRERAVIPPELEGVRPPEQYDTSTPLTAVELGRATGQSPKKIETLFNGYLGAWGGYLLAISDIGLRTLGDYPEAPATYLPERPVFRRLLGRDVPRSTYYSDKFYEMKREVDATWGSVQLLLAAGELDRARKILREHRGQIAVRDSLNKIQRMMTKLNRVQRYLHTSRTMRGDEKRERMDEIQRAKNRLMRMTEKLRPLYEKRAG